MAERAQEVVGAGAATPAVADAGLDPALHATRRARRLPDVARALARLYPDAAPGLLERVGAIVDAAAAARPAELRRLDLRREARPDWYQQPDMVGYVAYADRFAGDLAGVAARLDYLAELGVRYLHLMPLLRPRDGENDGGYAVAAYDEVDPRLGTMDDLEALGRELRGRDMSLCIDLVLNHTAREHAWAQAALAGDARYRRFYHLFPDRAGPDAYERTLREVFPAFAPGNFTWDADLEAWVWTTFNAFQWDLDWSNPDVLCAMLEAILALANRGVEIFRLDAVPFIWKRLGTSCENQPEVHELICALRALVAIAAPAVVFKAEAIVAPDDLTPYLGAGDPERVECELAYHNLLMVMLWSSLATREAQLLRGALERLGQVPAHAGWVTYVRCHDDIGWAVTDEDAGAVGWSGFHHRRFLNDFYSGAFPGSFAAGELFQVNEETGDARISGSAASLCGVERALERGDAVALDVALRRLELLHAVSFALGAIPLVYMGDELALRNDRTYVDDPRTAGDNRWLHRPPMDWDVAARRHVPGSVEARAFASIRRLVAARAASPELHGGGAIGIERSPHPAVLLVRRKHPREAPLWLVASFADEPVAIGRGELPMWRGRGHALRAGSAGTRLHDDRLALEPQGWAWLASG